MMRTTVTLEPDLAKKLKTLAHRRGIPFKQALNDAIRRGLSNGAQVAKVRKFTVRPHNSAFLPGVDPGKLNQLVDQLDVEDFLAKVPR